MNAVNDLSTDAKALRSRITDGKPGSAEAEALLSHATRFETTLKGRQAPGANSAWTGLAKHLQTVATAFGLSWPSARPAH